MKKYIVLAILVVLSLQTNAQKQVENQDKIVLKNGSVIYGKLLDYNSSKIVKFELMNNSILSIADSNIQSIQTNYTSNPVDETKTTGFYSYFGFKVLPSSSDSYRNGWYGYNKGGLGIGAELTIGYRISEYLYTGVGLGVENYNTYEKATFYPLFVDMMTLLKKSATTPFLRFQFGYSPVSTPKDDLKNTYNVITDSEGGLTYSPAFGIKFGGNKNLIYTLDFNYKYQKASFDYKQSKSTITRDIKYKRFSLRFGVLF